MKTTRSHSRETWITNGILMTQDESRRAIRANLRIVDRRIAAITTRSPSRGHQTKVIDASGLVIAPGFVQCHVHLCQTLFRNQADDLELLDWLAKRIWPMEAEHTAETLSASALLGIHELLSSGTTCLLDMGTVRHTEAIFNAVRGSGIRANVGKCLMDHPSNTPLGLREATAQALSEAQSLFKKWNGAENDRIRASYAPRFVISCSEELMIEVARLSKEQNAIIHTHASENRKEIELVREMSGGRENVDYLRDLGLLSERLVLAHGIWLNDRELEHLRASRVSVTHCPSSNLKLASGIARVPEMRALGINVALGADGAPCNNNLSALQEMRLAALIHKPGGGPRTLRAIEGLDMATRDGAKALHWFKDIGSIEVGKKADLTALDLTGPENTVPALALKSRVLDPEVFASAIVYASQASHVRFTMVDGQMLYEKGVVRTIPRAPLLERVARAQRRIAKALAK